MARIEVLLVGVLIALALLVGVLFGGSSIWFLKPSGGEQVIEKTVTKFVCYDGTVKDAQTDCPQVSSDGTTRIVCPPCKGMNVTDTSPFRRCDCTQCAAQCGAGGVVTTTIAPPKCTPCAANSDCGQPGYSDLRCKDDIVYKMYREPTCDESCCVVKETRNDVQTCSSSQRCRPAQGCVEYQDSAE